MNVREREALHEQIMNAIDRLKCSGFRVGPKMHDALYRMACVGAYAVTKDAAVLRSITTGRPLGGTDG